LQFLAPTCWGRLPKHRVKRIADKKKLYPMPPCPDLSEAARSNRIIDDKIVIFCILSTILLS